MTLPNFEGTASGFNSADRTGTRHVWILRETTDADVVDLDYRITFMRGSAGDFSAAKRTKVHLGGFLVQTTKIGLKGEDSIVTVVQVDRTP